MIIKKIFIQQYTNNVFKNVFMHENKSQLLLLKTRTILRTLREII